MTRPGAASAFRLLVLSCAALVLFAAPAVRAEQPARDGWDPTLLEQWVTAVERHAPGEIDSTLAGTAGWSGTDLRKLWADLHVLLEIVANPKRSRFLIPPLSFEPPPSRTHGPVILIFRRAERLVLDTLATRVRGLGLNPVLRRGAVLHTDVVTQGSSIATSADGAAGGPLRWFIGDGTVLAAEGQNLHWELARMLLSRVTPDPRRDTFVRDWYRATVATGQATEYFDALHLAHGLRLFPDDPELLLLAGAEREALATPLFQAFARSVQSTAMMTGIGSVDRELSAAADFYKHALDVDADFAEARVRLGRVLLLQGRHADAVRELRRAQEATLGAVYDYCAALFLGVALEALRDLDGAAGAFGRAGALEPGARAPHLALARLARERGNRELMMASLGRAMAPLILDDPIDPWWLYRSAQGRRRGSWLDEVRQRVRSQWP